MNLRSTAVAWVWIAGWPLGSQPHQTLGLRSIIPLLAARCCQGQGEKQCFLATHLEYRAFHLRASWPSLCDSLRVSATVAPCNRRSVDNQRFLSKTTPKTRVLCSLTLFTRKPAYFLARLGLRSHMHCGRCLCASCLLKPLARLDKPSAQNTRPASLGSGRSEPASGGNSGPDLTLVVPRLYAISPGRG